MKKALVVLLIGLLSACASQNKQPSAEVEDKSMGGSSRATESSPTTTSLPDRNPLTDPTHMLYKRSVFFDFDSYAVTDEYRPLVQAHAQYLRDNGNAKVLLQGNTDARGSREYNLALGQRRADSVKNAMTLSGAKDSQIESVSLGEEKPRGLGNNEPSWAENRRTDIRYQGE